MITLVHGGQRGVDRGAHDAAIANGWGIAGYMPNDQRDEFGRIPLDVARHLQLHESRSYAARTEANVRTSSAVLIVVRNADDPRTTPGTAKTIDLAAQRNLRCMIVDPTTDAVQIARWIKSGLVPLPLDLFEPTLEVPPMRLLVAGPRESRWSGARVETATLLHRVALALAEIARDPEPGRDLARP